MTNGLRFAWFGYRADGLPALEALLEAGAPIRDLFTLRRESGTRREEPADYRATCLRHAIRYHEIVNVNDAAARRSLQEASPDLAFILGWPQTVREGTIAIPRLGMIGAHASLLPQGHGTAPINWGIIRGDESCGSSLIWLHGRRDQAEVIDQIELPITPYDTCATVLGRVAFANREMLLRLLPRLLAGEVPRTAPRPLTGKPLPRRRDVDGELDWSQPTRAVYDMIRGLTRPAPGAFSRLEGERWRVWHAAFPRFERADVPPGTILGPVISPIDEACGQLVACDGGAIVILEVEGEDGRVLRGRALSDQPWTGRRWQDA